ncbi:MAG: hypothetical protein M0Z67_10010 [Nitrospiraceae bacterium]|nr:hypothetical protein [Nitrospiraceae bacterium]
MNKHKTRGRMINRDISNSEGFASLCPEAAVLFCMLIPHYNSYGKMNGGVGYIKDEICPRVPYLTYENMPGLLQEINDKTSVKWFLHDGRRWIHSINFLSEHQTLDKAKLGIDNLPSHLKSPVPAILACSESDLEDAIANILSMPEASLYNEKVLSVSRQVRVGNSYIDIRCDTASGPIIIELKRGRLSQRTVDQINSYGRAIGDCRKILIGHGTTVSFDLGSCEKDGVSVMVFDAALNLKPLLSLGDLCYLTLNNTLNNSYPTLNNTLLECYQEVEVEEEVEEEELSKDNSLVTRFQRDDVAYRLAGRLYSLILLNGCSDRLWHLTEARIEKKIQGWAGDMDKLVRIDKQEPQVIARVMRFAAEDDFWGPNILSGKKLRDKWDVLRARMEKVVRSATGTTPVKSERHYDAAGRELRIIPHKPGGGK